MMVDVIVVGSGQAGIPLAARLARAGKQVLLAERGELGGTCVNTGCTPTKTMIASARAAHVARTAARLGVRAGPVQVDLPAVVDRKDAIVRKWREGAENRLRQGGDRVTLVHGQARFTGERRIEVAGDTHTADIVVLDVGARTCSAARTPRAPRRWNRGSATRGSVSSWAPERNASRGKRAASRCGSRVEGSCAAHTYWSRPAAGRTPTISDATPAASRSTRRASSWPTTSTAPARRGRSRWET